MNHTQLLKIISSVKSECEKLGISEDRAMYYFGDDDITQVAVYDDRYSEFYFKNGELLSFPKVIHAIEKLSPCETHWECVYFNTDKNETLNEFGKYIASENLRLVQYVQDVEGEISVIIGDDEEIWHIFLDKLDAAEYTRKHGEHDRITLLYSRITN